MKIPEFKDIVYATERIKNIVHTTPVLTSESINQITGAKLFFKCENFQKVGAFKFRGATNAVKLLTKKQAEKGVATHSSGNHAAALALAARQAGIKAYIVMPETAPDIKKRAVAGYNAKITFCKPTLEARESTLNEVIAKTGATFIHPYNSFNVISGQGTAACELLNQTDNLDIIMAPIGGGGLMSGTSLSARYLKPSIKIYGCEPLMADDAYRSFKSNKLIPSENPKTIADGLLTSLAPITFEIIKKNVDEVFTATEQSIIMAMLMIWERMKIIIEPSSAVPLACILENANVFQDKSVGIIISGGNVDLKSVCNYI